MTASANLYDPVVYDAAAKGVPGDVDFYVALAKEAATGGDPVLEVTCGTGRVTIPIASEGVRVVGLDLSTAMLERARQKSAGMDNIRWVEGDMRDFELPERFTLALIPFRAFGHMLTVQDQLDCLGCIRRHLVPGGRLVINIFNPDVVRMGTWMSTRRGGLQAVGDGYGDPTTGTAGRRWESPSYHTADQHIDITFIDEQLDEKGAVFSRTYRDFKLRYAFRFEMEHLFARTGYEIESLYGDFFGETFGDTSPEQVWIARRPLED